MTRTVRIGGASSYYADSVFAVGQLLRAEPPPAYLMMDFMAEGTIGSMAKARIADPDAGWVTDFCSIHLANNLADIVAKRTKIVANAGGLNPKACAAAVEALLRERGVSLTVAYIDGDDLLPRADAIRAAGTKDMFTDQKFPETAQSVNAYLGAWPIAAALAAGADIVVTGRCADSALGLGPLIHEFGWRDGEWDKLAAGTLVGHLLECGCQVTGGTFTDWQDVPGWEEVGFPIADVAEDGSCVISKPAGTGGLVSIGTVAEQLLYEVSDPQAYIVPDVVCDFSAVRLAQAGEDRVAVSGARGTPATDSFKTVASYEAGWRGMATQVIIGIDAAAKAQRQGEAMIERGRRLLRERNIGPYLRTDVEVVGAEAAYGPRGNVPKVREVLLRASADHTDRAGAELYLRESRASTSGMAVGSTATYSVTLTPISKLLLFLVPKTDVAARIVIGGQATAVPQPPGEPFSPAAIARAGAPEAPQGSAAGTVPLIRLAWARSGDKGNLFNVAAIARDPAYLPHIRAALTPEAVGAWFAHLYADGVKPKVDVFDVPGFHAVNYVLRDSLDGGLLISPRVDAAAKGMAQQLLEFPVPVPASLL